MLVNDDIQALSMAVGGPVAVPDGPEFAAETFAFNAATVRPARRRFPPRLRLTSAYLLGLARRCRRGRLSVLVRHGAWQLSGVLGSHPFDEGHASC